MPKLSLEIVLAVISVLIAFGGFLFTYFGYILKLQKNLGDTKNELTKDFATQLAIIQKEFNTECVAIGDELKECIHQVGNKLAGFENQVVARLVTLETKTSLFWKVVEEGVIDMIKQPIHFEKDKLLDNLKSLSGEDLQKLKFMLEDELIELKKGKDPKVVAYVIMLARIDQRLYEKQCSCAEDGTEVGRS